MAIRSFKNRAIEQFFLHEKISAKVSWFALRKIVQRKLDILDYATHLDDLKAPPGNRLEALKGNFIGYYSIRINDQWRIIFKWTEQGPTQVDIVDYH